MKMIFSLSTGKLMVSCASFAMTLPATSGRGVCKNNSSHSCQAMPFEGPIPVGDYYIDPKDLSDPGFIGDIARNFRPDSPGDWGDFRIKIQPLSTTRTYGRNNFFLHGGSYEGSAGCIDVGGGLSGNEQTHLLKTAIRASVGKIPLRVMP